MSPKVPRKPLAHLQGHASPVCARVSRQPQRRPRLWRGRRESIAPLLSTETPNSLFQARLPLPNRPQYHPHSRAETSCIAGSTRYVLTMFLPLPEAPHVRRFRPSAMLGRILLPLLSPPRFGGVLGYLFAPFGR